MAQNPSTPVRLQSEPAIPVPNHSSPHGAASTPVHAISSPHANAGVNATLPHGTSVDVHPATTNAVGAAQATTGTGGVPSAGDPHWMEHQRAMEQRWAGYPVPAPHLPRHLMRGEDRLVYDPLAREEFLADVDAQRLRTLTESMSTVSHILI